MEGLRLPVIDGLIGAYLNVWCEAGMPNFKAKFKTVSLKIVLMV